MKQLTNDEFIKRATFIHDGKYNYNKTVYLGSRNKVIITCPIHGDFMQIPANHLSKQGCWNCSYQVRSINLRHTLDDFVELAKKQHGLKYDYTKSQYITSKDLVMIQCPIHGEFKQIASDHLKGYGCQKCGIISCKEAKKYSQSDFINFSTLKHGELYDYSNSKYASCTDKIEIICKKHGSFFQIPYSHWNGFGCPSCGYERTGSSLRSNLNEFILKAKTIHEYQYDYSKSKYLTNNQKIEIICKKHGSFLQTPGSHLRGRGCSICQESHGERRIARILTDRGIEFERQFKLALCKRYLPLPFDFCIYTCNKLALIEYQGEQHYQPVMFDRIDKGTFQRTQENDEIKKNFCDLEKIPLLIIPYWEYKNIDRKIDQFMDSLSAND